MWYAALQHIYEINNHGAKEVSARLITSSTTRNMQNETWGEITMTKFRMKVNYTFCFSHTKTQNHNRIINYPAAQNNGEHRMMFCNNYMKH